MNMKMRKNIKTLQQIERLQYNWNSYGAQPFSKNLINYCLKIIKQLSIQPEIFPTARNSIQFEYEIDNIGYVEFEIYETKEIEYYNHSCRRMIKMNGQQMIDLINNHIKYGRDGF